MTNAYINALITSSRVLGHNFTFNSLPDKSELAEITSATKLEFGYSHEESFDLIAARVLFDVSIDAKEGGNFAKYQSQIQVEFKVIEKHGFDSWDSMPPQTPLPYLAIAHHTAREHAMSVFRNAGLKNIHLPIPEEFTGGDKLLEVDGK